MYSIERLLHLIDAYAAAARLSPSTVSTKIFNDGKRVALIRAGGDIGTRQLARAIQWLSEHWPEGAIWPEGFDRPAPPAIPCETAQSLGVGVENGSRYAPPEAEKPAPGAAPEATEGDDVEDADEDWE